MEICRVCMVPSAHMVNIFDSLPGESTSIADMIFQCTRFEVSVEDSYPNTICPDCLEDAKNAYEIKELYEKSRRLVCQNKRDFDEEQNLPKENISEISDYESDSGADTIAVKVVNEEVDKGKSRREQLYGQVKNEPIEEDIFEEDYLKIVDRDADNSDFEVKCEEIEPNIKKNAQCYENDEDQSKAKLEKKGLSHKCSHCEKTFSQNKSLQLHIRTHTGERPYKCSHCQRTFSQNRTLQIHNRTHTGKGPYKCPQCQKSFSRKIHFQRHIRTHTENRPYKCSHCQKSFSHSRTLELHIRSHTDERLYKCSHCLECFLRKGTLQEHMLIHTGERPYKCSHCQKSFSHSRTLQLHIRIHTGERPYKCSYCQESFARKESLQRHILTHTGERPYKCSRCHKSFTRQNILKMHMDTHTVKH